MGRNQACGNWTKSVLTRRISSKVRLGGEMTLICSSNNKNMHIQTGTNVRTQRLSCEIPRVSKFTGTEGTVEATRNSRDGEMGY